MSTGLYSGAPGLALGVGLYAGNPGLWGGAPGLITGDGGQTLSLNFLAGAPLDSRITFTRASTATFTGSNGLIQSSAINSPRFDYDPVTLAAKGLLIEAQRTNLLSYSQDFDNAAWTKSNVTVTADSTVAPDGTTTGDTVTGVTPGTANILSRNFTADATLYTYSIWVMAGTATTCALLLRDNTTPTNLPSSAQIISGPGSVSGTTTILVSGLSTTQWTRVAITTNAAMTAGNLLGVYFYPEASVGATTTAKSNMIWGAQVEAGASVFATSYIPTVASQVTRTADQCSIVAPNYAPWYNVAEGTLVAAFTLLPRTLSGTAVIAYNGNANGRWSYLSSASARMNDGTNTAVAGSIATPTAITKTASALSSAGMAISLNGAAPGTSAYVGTFGTQNALEIGQQSGASSINGHIRSIAYYNTRLPNATLQALSA